MRINVYAEELTDRVEVVTKAPPNHPDTEFAGIRMYLASPDALHADPDDDDSSAITIWVPWNVRGGHRPEAVTNLLRSMADLLDDWFAPAVVNTVTDTELVADAEPIDTLNYFFVSSNGKTFTVQRQPIDISADDAIGLAAWLVVMAEPFATHTFDDVRRAVMAT